MIVRDMVLTDCAEVGRIHVEAWQKTYRGIMPQDFLDALDPVTRAEQWRQGLSKTSQMIRLVSTKNDRAIGFATGLENRTPQLVPEANGELWAIYVDPHHWGSGAGSALLKAFQARMQTSICVWVASENKIGHRFYEKTGGKLLRVKKDEEIAGKKIPHDCYLYSY